MSAKLNKNLIRLNVFLSLNDCNAVKQIADKEGSNASIVIRRAVKEYLDKLQNKVSSNE